MMEAYWDHVERAGLDDNPYRAGFVQIVVVGETDAEAERLYLPHIQNLYAKSLHIPSYLGAVPGYMSIKSIKENMLKSGGSSFSKAKINPYETDWNTYTNVTKQVIGGSPDTVVAGLEEAIRTLRFGHLMVILQFQSMDRDLTEYNTRLFAEKVMPRLRGIWSDTGYEDRWWPVGARGGGAHAGNARTIQPEAVS
jgi:alkanesulfonate monooxygenase SsuD/methylene tetrahydromethanopterin reductase-like flavin-dependent oxidoreductase (luciferase family)